MQAHENSRKSVNTLQARTEKKQQGQVLEGWRPWRERCRNLARGGKKGNLFSGGRRGNYVTGKGSEGFKRVRWGKRTGGNVTNLRRGRSIQRGRDQAIFTGEKSSALEKKPSHRLQETGWGGKKTGSKTRLAGEEEKSCPITARKSCPWGGREKRSHRTRKKLIEETGKRAQERQKTKPKFR